MIIIATLRMPRVRITRDPCPAAKCRERTGLMAYCAFKGRMRHINDRDVKCLRQTIQPEMKFGNGMYQEECCYYGA